MAKEIESDVRVQVHDWVDQIFDQHPLELTIDRPAEVRIIRGSNPIQRRFTGWHGLNLRWKGESVKWTQEVNTDGY